MPNFVYCCIFAAYLAMNLLLKSNREIDLLLRPYCNHLIRSYSYLVRHERGATEAIGNNVAEKKSHKRDYYDFFLLFLSRERDKIRLQHTNVIHDTTNS